MEQGENERPATSVRTMELVVASFLFVLGAIVMYDSARIGYQWAADGPESGYFPFYVGLLICISAAVTFYHGLGDRSGFVFVTVPQLRLVLKMLVPSIVFVVLVGLIGIYVSATLYIAFFMRWLGLYRWSRLLPVAVGVSVALYLLFEVWFRVPLPKGPLEAWLGLD